MGNNEGYVDILVEDMRLDDPDLRPWDGRSGPTVPPGPYEFECVSADREKSKKGNPMITAEFRVVGGEYDGQTMKAWYTLDGTKSASRGRLLNVIKALNVPILNGGAFSIQAWIGQHMEADVEAETQAGTYDPVRNVNLPERTFAKIVNERPVSGGQAPAQAPQTQPQGGAQNTAQGTAPAASRRPVGNANGARTSAR